MLLQAGMAAGALLGLAGAVYITWRVLDRVGAAADAARERNVAKQAVQQGCGCCCQAGDGQSAKSCCAR